MLTHTRMRQYLLALLLAGCAAGPALAAKNASPKDLEALKSRIRTAQSEAESLRGEARDQEKDLRSAEMAIAQVSREISKLENAIRRENQKLDSLRQERTTLQASRDRQQELLKKQLRESWELGREQQLRVLFNQEHPETLSRSLTWYGYFSEARGKAIDSYRATIARLDALEPEILASTETLKASRQQLLGQQSQLATHQQERKQALAALKNRIGTVDDRIAGLQRQRKDIESLLRKMEQANASIPRPADARPINKTPGSLPWPIHGRLAESFGDSRGNGMNWQGVLIAAPSGTPVKAIHNGRIVFADWFGSLGLLVIVDHGDEFLSLYAHNESLSHEVGDWVQAGDTIAAVGSSGGQAEPGLYFEIRRHGKPEDPERWCGKFS